MSINCAYVVDGVVTNMVVMPDDYDGSDPNIIIPSNPAVSIGWLYDGTNWTMPQSMIQDQYNTKITVANLSISQLEVLTDPTQTNPVNPINQILLPRWQSYLAALQSMDLTTPNPPVWPTQPTRPIGAPVSSS